MGSSHWESHANITAEQTQAQFAQEFGMDADLSWVRCHKQEIEIIHYGYMERYMLQADVVVTCLPGKHCGAPSACVH